jgi:hypothetical protein
MRFCDCTDTTTLAYQVVWLTATVPAKLTATPTTMSTLWYQRNLFGETNWCTAGFALRNGWTSKGLLFSRIAFDSFSINEKSFGPKKGNGI